MKQFIYCKRAKSHLNLPEIITISCLSSFITVGFTNVFDTFIINYYILPGNSKSQWEYARELYKRNGLKWFNRGFWISNLYMSLSGLIIFPVYEFTSQKYLCHNK